MTKPIELFHGTSKAVAARLTLGHVDVSKGGGELGRGFYTHQHIHLAKTWAANVAGRYRNNVTRFVVPEDDFWAQTFHLIRSARKAAAVRNGIRRANATRTRMFGKDVVWAPIVGNASIKADQLKWESTKSEALLNSSVCKRSVV